MRQMKDSGIEWIGQIPQTWDVRKGKYLFAQRNERGNNVKLQLLSPTQNYGVIPQDEYERLSGMSAVKLNENINLKALKTIHKGDYCISLRSFQGGFEYSMNEGVISPAYQVFYPTVKISGGYYKYLFKDKGFISVINSYAMSLRDGKNISFEQFGNTVIPVPPLAEQERIAGFLDAKCAEVDALAGEIKEQIATLEEYKRSVITEAVTKGLDASVPMKDSGIEWIGEIPQSWDVLPNKYIMKKTKELCQKYSGQAILSLTMNGVIERDLDAGGKMPSSFDGYQLIKKGNLLLCLFDIDVTPRCAGLILKDGVTSPAYSQFVMTNMAYAPYFAYYYIMVDNTKELLHMTKNLRYSLNEEQFGAIKAPCPPLAEQERIAEFLDAKCAEVDALIAEKQNQLATLEEYKKSVIFEYVTGKKEVV